MYELTLHGIIHFLIQVRTTATNVPIAHVFCTVTQHKKYDWVNKCTIFQNEMYRRSKYYVRKKYEMYEIIE